MKKCSLSLYVSYRQAKAAPRTALLMLGLQHISALQADPEV